MQRGASMVKWTTLNPCISSSKSNSKLYTNFEIYEEKNHRHLEKLLIYKAKHKNNFKESLHILKDGTNGVQVGDIEAVIV